MEHDVDFVECSALGLGQTEVAPDGADNGHTAKDKASLASDVESSGVENIGHNYGEDEGSNGLHCGSKSNSPRTELSRRHLAVQHKTNRTERRLPDS